MDQDDFKRYWRPARNNLVVPHSGPHYLYGASVRLSKALGIEYSGPGAWRNIELTDALKDQLLLLASSHFETIIKAMKIRSQDDNHVQIDGG